MRVWLDDIRPMPESYDRWAKTYEQAINWLESGLVTLMSFDHDLGEGKTGYDVAKWVEENAFNGNLKPIKVRVHTQNPVGRKNICMALQNAVKHWNDS